MKRFRFSLRALLTLTVVLAVCLTAVGLYSPTPRNRLRWLYGGRVGRNTVAKSEEVYAYRARPPKNLPYEYALASDFRVDSGPELISQSDADKLRRTFLAVDSYDWEWDKACGFNPDYKVSFIRGKEKIDVILDSGCDVLRVYHNNQYLGFEDFDKVHSVIIPILRNALKRE
jgi:hypothetical protein